MTLGTRIKSAREEKGLSQTELARRIGSLTRNSVSLWEADKTRPHTAHLLKLVDVLGVDPFWLFGDQSRGSAVEVPLISWVSAGRLDNGETVEAWTDVPKVWACGLGEGEWIALDVEGTSMDRIAPPGSRIFVNTREKALVPKKFYVIATPDGSTFKEYRANPQRFEPFSTQPGHETLFPEGPVKVIGRVKRIQIDV